MGAAPSMEAQALRAELQAPLRGAAAAAAGVLGTYALDVELESPTCGPTYRSSPIWCCCGREEFRVPWPCHCCGANCVCCPHSPRGAAWEAALAAGFAPMLRDAGAMVARSAGQRYSAQGADGRPVGDVEQNVILANARSQLLAQWQAHANAFLAPFGLSVRAWNWIEERRNDKGAKTGEVLRCAVQVYERSQHQAPLLEGSGALAAAGSAPPQFYPPPPLQQQGAYQHPGNASSGAPKSV